MQQAPSYSMMLRWTLVRVVEARRQIDLVDHRTGFAQASEVRSKATALVFVGQMPDRGAHATSRGACFNADDLRADGPPRVRKMRHQQRRILDVAGEHTGLVQCRAERQDAVGRQHALCPACIPRRRKRRRAGSPSHLSACRWRPARIRPRPLLRIRWRIRPACARVPGIVRLGGRHERELRRHGLAENERAGGVQPVNHLRAVLRHVSIIDGRAHPGRHPRTLR